jgi:hypothetical protein
VSLLCKGILRSNFKKKIVRSSTNKQTHTKKRKKHMRSIFLDWLANRKRIYIDEMTLILFRGLLPIKDRKKATVIAEGLRFLTIVSSFYLFKKIKRNDDNERLRHNIQDYLNYKKDMDKLWKH